MICIEHVVFLPYDDDLWFHCKGHVERQAFSDALKALTGEPLDENDEIDLLYARNCHTALSRANDLNYEIRFASRQWRGMYPVTVWFTPHGQQLRDDILREASNAEA